MGSVLLNQMEYAIEVLMKFDPSFQLKTRTIPWSQASFASKQAHHVSSEQALQKYVESFQALANEDIIEANKLKMTNPKLRYNSDQVPINFPSIVGCLTLCMANYQSNQFDHSWPGHLLHSNEAHMSISTSHIELRVAMCSNTSTV